MDPGGVVCALARRVEEVSHRCAPCAAKRSVGGHYARRTSRFRALHRPSNPAMSSPLVFVRDERTLPYIPVTAAALTALKGGIPKRRLAYARSLYMALLELANEDRRDRVAVSRKALAERSGCSPELISDLRPLLEAVGVVTVRERTHGGQILEHEWAVIEPPPVQRTPMPARHDPPAPQARLSQEEQQETTGERTRPRASADELPDDFPEALRPHVRQAYRVLRGVAEQHGARAVSPRALGLVLMARPRKPLVRAAYDFASWAANPPRPIRDVVASYRTWLDRCEDLASTEVIGADGAPTGPVRPGNVRPLRSRGDDLRQVQILENMRMRMEATQ